MVYVKCPKCSHIWNTKSKAVYVSCSSCISKVRVKKNIVEPTTFTTK